MKIKCIDLYKTLFFILLYTLFENFAMSRQTFTAEEIPRPLSQVSFLQVFANHGNPAFIIAVADTVTYAPSPFDYWSGYSFFYSSKWNASSFREPLFIDTAHSWSWGLGGYLDEFISSISENSSSNLFVAWVKQHVEYGDIPPKYYVTPVLQIAVEQNGTFRRTAQISQGTRPHIVFDHTNHGYVAWEQTVPRSEIPGTTQDSNYLVYSSSIMYSDLQSDGSLGVSNYLGTGFRPRMVVDDNNNVHFFWLNADSSTSPIFKIMHCQLLPGGTSSPVTLKDSVPIIESSVWSQSVLPTINYFVDSLGNAYAGWTEFQDMGGTIYFVQQKYDNSIQVFSHHADTMNQQSADFFVQSNGTKYCVWHELRNNSKFFNYSIADSSQSLFSSTRSFKSGAQNFHLVESSDRKVHCIYEHVSTIVFLRNVADTNEVTVETLSPKRISSRWYDEYNHPVAIDGDDQIWVAYESNTSSNMEGIVRILRQTTPVLNIPHTLPDKSYLSQNYPNPFNPTTSISFHISHPGFVRLSVYDILGRKIANLIHEQRQAGDYSIPFDAQNYSSGIYFYRLHITPIDRRQTFDEFITTRRMILLK